MLGQWFVYWNCWHNHFLSTIYNYCINNFNARIIGPILVNDMRIYPPPPPLLFLIIFDARDAQCSETYAKTIFQYSFNWQVEFNPKASRAWAVWWAKPSTKRGFRRRSLLAQTIFLTFFSLIYFFSTFFFSTIFFSFSWIIWNIYKNKSSKS